MTVRNSLLGGRSAGLFTAMGICIGQVIWALATSAGIVALLIASEPLFLAVKYAGVAYLIYLGCLSLRDALWPAAGAAALAGMHNAGPRISRRVAFRQGLMSDLGNPKMAFFFASLLPQFVPAGEATFFGFLGLGLVFVTMAFVWLALYASVVAKFGDLLRRGAVRRVIEGISGAVLIGFGLRIAAEQR